MADSERSISLLPLVTCPTCWNRFPPEEILWVATHSSLIGDARAGAAEYRRFLPTLFTVDGRALDEPGEACQELACPRCHAIVNRGLLEMEPLFLAILGAPSSGKSFYLATMIHSVRAILSKKFHLRFENGSLMSRRVPLKNGCGNGVRKAPSRQHRTAEGDGQHFQEGTWKNWRSSSRTTPLRRWRSCCTSLASKRASCRCSALLNVSTSREKKILKYEEQLDPEVQKERARWRKKTRHIDPKRLVFVDESSAKTNMTRLYGRAPRGERVVGFVPDGRWESSTMLSALRYDGTTTTMVYEGGTETPLWST